ncbi:MAG: ribosome biogenesis GTPase Der [Patescibacteria group bacterium]|nr:ribosome biogenesis GTPase Der [Patescibacteria group bacterium]
MTKLPIITIVGRINVGKSSLFNRLTESHKALISKIPGTTRDYNIGLVAWQRKTFEVIDTGGVDIDILKNSISSLLDKKKPPVEQGTEIEQGIINQTKVAIKKAQILLLVVDGKSGLMPQDKELALILKKIGKPVMLVCNKVDNKRLSFSTNEFFKLGLGQPYPISAANSSGVGDFLDELVKKLKVGRGRPKKDDDTPAIKIALIGKPNAGKSSLVNKILGEERVIVSDIAQTTREPQDTQLIYKDKKITIIDTAGLRKKHNIKGGLERMATRRTLAMIDSADIILLITEVDKDITKQDLFLGGLVKDAGAGIIVVSNKWDLLEHKDEKLGDEIRKYYQQTFPYLSFAPLINVSAKTGKNVDKILDLVLAIAVEREKIIAPDQLDEIIKEVTQRHWPSQAKGPLRPKIYGLSQTGTKPPTFTVLLGPKQSLHFSYLRFIENKLRERFSFEGVPVRMKVKTAKH